MRESHDVVLNTILFPGPGYLLRRPGNRLERFSLNYSSSTTSKTTYDSGYLFQVSRNTCLVLVNNLTQLIQIKTILLTVIDDSFFARQKLINEFQQLF